jgi:hypothetical protein
MIIKIRRVKKTRIARRCGHCDRWIAARQEAVYMFGAPFYGDKPYGIWVHADCMSDSAKAKLGVIDAKKVTP